MGVLRSTAWGCPSFSKALSYKLVRLTETSLGQQPCWLGCLKRGLAECMTTGCDVGQFVRSLPRLTLAVLVRERERERERERVCVMSGNDIKRVLRKQADKQTKQTNEQSVS